MKKLCGYDLNGWRDFGTRNWLIASDGEETACDNITEGGVFGSVVTVGDLNAARLVGGAQASLAPHGRGGGWGDVGHTDRRIRVRSLLTSPDPNVSALSSAFSGMFLGAGTGVASIDDVPDSSEILQERLLSALRRSKISTPLLVWRSVLSALYALSAGFITSRCRIGVINHIDAGFSAQTLIIRNHKGDSEGLLAPERRSFGQRLECSLGYEHLAQAALAGLETSVSRHWSAPLDSASSVARLVLGLEGKPELIRMNNGDWEVLQPPRELPMGSQDIPRGILDLVRDCDVVLLETLTEGSVRRHIEDCFSNALGMRLVPLPPSAVAQGALVAATRMGSREPVYFDFLPQISTIVQKPSGAESYDLIDPETTLPAGEIYRSPSPAQFAIQADQSSFSIYLCKQNALKPRKATVDLGMKLSATVPVELSVEQTPASGRARIFVYAGSLSRQFLVDWDTAEELDDDWSGLLNRLEKPDPTIPTRLIIPCSRVLWDASVFEVGFTDLVNANANNAEVDWKALADKADDRYARSYAVSSDGKLPSEVDDVTAANLQRLIDRAVSHLRSRLSGTEGAGNDSLRFLTWLFRLCPREVAIVLLDSWDQQVSGHKLFNHPSHWKLAYQGFGRIVSDRTLELRAMHKILQKPIQDWVWQRETAALAFMLSRSETAPRQLTRQNVELLAKRVILEFRESLGTTYSKFHYAPFLLVGLIRWRMVDRNALVIGTDPVADALAKATKRTLVDLDHRSRTSAQAKYGVILEQILEELQGQGSNPDLLLDIYAGEEG
jgi:hypothetical protein